MPTLTGSSKPRQRGWPIAMILAGAGVFALMGLLTLSVGAFFAYRSLHAAPEQPVAALIEAPAEAPPAPPIVQPVAQKPADPLPLPKKLAVVPGQKAANELAANLLRQINTYRKTAGLGLVQLDAELTRGCAAHAKYLALNPPTGPGGLADEDGAKPGFSEDGRRAAGFAMISIGDPRGIVEQWMARLGGRLPLLQPDLRVAGLGVAPLDGGAWVAVLDVLRSGGDPVVLYPAPNQKDVPLTFTGGPELPEGGATAGFPATATFPPLKKVEKVQAELRDDAGKPVAAWLFTPAKPARPQAQRNTVALIAKAPLTANRLYRVRITATVDGEPWSKAWTFTTEDDADGKGLWAKQALERVNAYRKLAGLSAVTLDPAQSKGCLAHARYLALNLGHPATAGLGAHDEDLSLPGASEEGRKSGKASDIAIGDHEPLHGLEAWMATLYHRVPILEPNLKSVGFGCVRARRQGWITVLNVHTGRAPGLRPSAVFYPVPDQTGVPLHFPIGGEEPNPIPDDTTGRAGYPVTAFFPQDAPLKSASMSLTDAAGREVAAWFSSAEQPANRKYAKNQGNTVCLIAKEPLRPNTTYRVVLRGRRGTEGWDKSWQFTTGTGGLSVAQGVQQAMQRLNAARAAAGLAAVTLDAGLSRGCQAHAEYLVRNGAAMAKKKLPANDEDPALPGYTAIGKLAARQSAVFSRAPEPVTQIEDLMGTFLRRVYVLDPNLRRVGYGCAHDVGRGWHCVLDLSGGRGGDRIVLYPVPDQEAVPCTGTDRLPKQKAAPGFPISVTFPASAKIFGARGTLTDADGKVIEALVATPEHPVANLSGAQRNTVSLHPRAPLRPGQTYHVSFTVVVNGQEWRQSWQFATE